MISTTVCGQLCRRGLGLGVVPRTNSCIRGVSSTPKVVQEVQFKSTHDDRVEKYHMIYKFPYIRFVRAVCRLKIYQTAVTTVAVPYVGYLAYIGSVSTDIFTATAFTNGLAIAMLYVMGELFRRIVGHIYCNPGTDLIKISHLSFWGKRRNLLVPLSDIVPITDTFENPSDIYVNLLRYSQPKFSFFLCLRFGGVLDYQKFNEVFGELDLKEQGKSKAKL